MQYFNNQTEYVRNIAMMRCLWRSLKQLHRKNILLPAYRKSILKRLEAINRSLGDQ